MSYDSARFAQCANDLATIGRELSARGWTPATSSNFSLRLDQQHIAITISGRDKGQLSSNDIMVVDLNGDAVNTSAHPSAETLLHTQIYQRRSAVGAVLHTHSRTQTVASRLFAQRGSIHLAGYELLKAFAGITTHNSALDVPVLPNSQNMQDLTAQVEIHLSQPTPLYGYLIDGHGIYAWGENMHTAKRHLEALEFLLACELDLHRLKI